MRLQDKIAIVTGAAQGLGAVYAQALAREGADLVVADIAGDRLKAVAEEMQTTGRRCLPIQADLTDEAQVERVVVQTLQEMGGLHILVNNAGGAIPNMPSTTSIAQTSVETWDQFFEFNMKTAFLCCKAVADHMKQQGYGRVVNVSSRNARVAGVSRLVCTPYSAAKAGVEALTRNLAWELGPYGVIVNCISPGWCMSNRGQRTLFDAMTEEDRQHLINITAVKRLIEPEEIARMVVFLCSDELTCMTGATLDVSGGSWMY